MTVSPIPRDLELDIKAITRALARKYPDLGHEDIAVKVMQHMEIPKTPFMREWARQVVLGLEPKT